MLDGDDTERKRPTEGEPLRRRTWVDLAAACGRRWVHGSRPDERTPDSRSGRSTRPLSLPRAIGVNWGAPLGAEVHKAVGGARSIDRYEVRSAEGEQSIASRDLFGERSWVGKVLDRGALRLRSPERVRAPGAPDRGLSGYPAFAVIPVSLASSPQLLKDIEPSPQVFYKGCFPVFLTEFADGAFLEANLEVRQLLLLHAPRTATGPGSGLGMIGQTE